MIRRIANVAFFAIGLSAQNVMAWVLILDPSTHQLAIAGSQPDDWYTLSSIAWKAQE